MSNQPEYEKLQPETMTPQEIRESILTELEASKQAIAELSDEALEEIVGGGNVIMHAHARLEDWLRQPLDEFLQYQPPAHAPGIPSTPSTPSTPATPATSMTLSGPSPTASSASNSSIIHRLPDLKRSHSAHF